MKNNNSLFITFEGLDGCGKTTQAKLLQLYLQLAGIKSIYTKEPGGTEIGNEIRKILLNPDNFTIDIYTELFLLMANRNQHVNELILPALNDGYNVICDRFSESTYIYQGGKNGISDYIIDLVNDIATKNVKDPDITFIIDTDIDMCLSRMKDKNNRLDNFCKENFKYLEQNLYERAIISNRKNMYIIDGNKSIVDVANDIVEIVDNYFKLKKK